MLAEAANSTKKGGQELVGGLDVRVHRNHFGRQIESFETGLDLPFLSQDQEPPTREPYPAIFIRAPVVDKLLPHTEGIQRDEAAKADTVVAPSKQPKDRQAASHTSAEVEILGRLPGKGNGQEPGDIVAVKQGNVFGTSFHPELTGDTRIHAWWLGEVIKAQAQG